ncbi:hypothetical protein ACFVZH_39885 [Streptomyces sp. NPDC059534]|uniref:hypothetical protein n=1 Tax=Streptomyces sp. NPDC059534 TaxID=3346859 RepID=UPI0036B58F3E
MADEEEVARSVAGAEVVDEVVERLVDKADVSEAVAIPIMESVDRMGVSIG